MPELDENDLRKLFRSAGHHAPGRDMTARIMARVAVTPMTRLDITKPLISKQAWLGAGIGLAVLIGAIAVLPHEPGPADGPMATVLSTVQERLSRFTVPGSWLTWGAITLGGLLFLSVLDGTLMRASRRSAN